MFATMYAKTFITLLLSALAAQALPAKRDSIYDEARSQVTAEATNIASAEGTFDQLTRGSPTPMLKYSTIASLILSGVHRVLGQAPSASQSQFTAYITTIAGVPIVEVSSIGGPVITHATSIAGAIPTQFAGQTFYLAPERKNGASKLVVSKPLLMGMGGALGAVAAGAMMLL
ncbi:hypothetical protein VTO73DRAFT_14381 [Trametes versicolor]